MTGLDEFAMKVSVDTVEGLPVPQDLWTERHIEEVLAEGGLPPPSSIRILDPHTFLWYEVNPAHGGITGAQAAQRRHDLRRVAEWHDGDTAVQVDAIPIPLATAKRLEYRAGGVRASALGSGRESLYSSWGDVSRARPKTTDYDTASEDSSFTSDAAPRARPQRLIRSVPKIQAFNGESDGAKARTYEGWRFDVECLLQGGYDPSALRSAVLFSLEGTPGIRARQLGVHATVPEVLAHLDLVYKEVRTYDELTKALYAVSQMPRESVSSFEQRLSKAVATLQLTYPQRCGQDNIEERRRERFFRGLHQDLRNGLRYLFNRDPPVPYDRLLKAARESERDEQSTYARLNKDTRKPWTGPLRQNAAVTTASELTPEEEEEGAASWHEREEEADEKLRKAAVKFSMHMGKMAERQFLESARRANKGELDKNACFRCGEVGHYARECPTNVRHQALNGKGGGARRPSPPPAPASSVRQREVPGATPLPSQ